MKYTINKLGWIGLILTLTIMFATSCKKEKSPTPTPTSSTTHYQLTSIRQYDEASDIYVYVTPSGTTISNPTLSAYADTVNTTFNQYVAGGLPLHINGTATITGTTITLNYYEIDTMNTSLNHSIYNAIYIEI